MPSPPTPRILFLTTDYPPDLGGLQTYSHRIATGLPGNLLGWVAVGTDRDSEPLPRPAGGAALLVHRGRTRWRAFAWSLGCVLTLRMQGRPDALLHMQWSTALPSYLLHKLGLGRPYVILVHGAELLDPGRPFFNRLKSAILAEAAAVVAGSRATAELFTRLGLRSRRLEVIHYGNPLDGRNPAIGQEPKGIERKNWARNAAAIPQLLCMHRLVARKGTELLLRTLARVKDLPWALKVVGRGEEESALRRLAKELGLDPRIAFEPPVDEAAKAALLDRADLFLLPSLPPDGNNHMEGLGLTLLEAQGRGLPVLAARTGGIPEAVDEGRTGMLFEAGDPDDLEARLRTLLADSALRDRLGAAGPAWVREHFDWEKSLARLAELLRETSAGK